MPLLAEGEDPSIVAWQPFLTLHQQIRCNADEQAAACRTGIMNHE